MAVWISKSSGDLYHGHRRTAVDLEQRHLLFSASFSSLLFSGSSHLCFPSVHIVGGLTSKLPSTNYGAQHPGFNLLYKICSFDILRRTARRDRIADISILMLSKLYSGRLTQPAQLLIIDLNRRKTPMVTNIFRHKWVCFPPIQQAVSSDDASLLPAWQAHEDSSDNWHEVITIFVLLVFRPVAHAVKRKMVPTSYSRRNIHSKFCVQMICFENGFKTRAQII